MKKILSLMIALVMLLCSVSALAESAGGWTIPENTALEDDTLNSFFAAVGDAELYPQMLMATQVVAGVNYAVLCAAPKCAEIAYVYHNVSGEDQLVREQQLLPLGDDVDGGWGELLDEEATEIAFNAVDAAFETMTGISVNEYYILGQQVAAGTNYAVLCRKETVTAEPVEGWAMAIVTVDPQGAVSITDMQDVVLSLTEE